MHALPPSRDCGVSATHGRRFARWRHIVAIAAILQPIVGGGPARAEWLRGNLHTHTSRSDGDSEPVEVADWYRGNGYDFIVISDHERLTPPPLLGNDGARPFLVLPGIELTQEVRDPAHPDGMREIHLVGIGLRREVHALGTPYHNGFGRLAPDGSAPGMLVDRAVAQIRDASGIAMINHPNFRWSLQPAHLANLPSGTLLEIWNAQGVHNNLGAPAEADRGYPSAEQIWDGLLSSGKRVWAVADDDAHHFKRLGDLLSARPGRAWVEVNAAALTAQSIQAALARGDFYATTGVRITSIEVKDKAFTIRLTQSERRPASKTWSNDARYRTEFFGRDGILLATQGGLAPSYRIRGDEGYVRARVTSSNGAQAWTQPVFTDAIEDRKLD